MNHLPISAVIWAFTMSVLFRAFCVIFFHCSAALYLQHAITENDEQPSAKPFWRWQFPKFSRVFFRCLCFFFRPVILLRYSNNYDFTFFFSVRQIRFFYFTTANQWCWCEQSNRNAWKDGIFHSGSTRHQVGCIHLRSLGHRGILHSVRWSRFANISSDDFDVEHFSARRTTFFSVHFLDHWRKNSFEISRQILPSVLKREALRMLRPCPNNNHHTRKAYVSSICMTKKICAPSKRNSWHRPHTKSWQNNIESIQSAHN